MSRKPGAIHSTPHVLVGGNNVGKSTVCDALNLMHSPDQRAEIVQMPMFVVSSNYKIKWTISRTVTTEHLTRWRQLCDMELQAQSMNQRIGTLIDLRLASTRQALNVLIHAATNQGGLYDQAGLSVGTGNGKRIIAV